MKAKHQAKKGAMQQESRPSAQKLPKETPDEKRLRELREQYEHRLPSALELAHLAASLGGNWFQPGVKMKIDELKQLASDALWLWRVCASIRAQDIKFDVERQLRLEKERAKQADCPKPAKFPVLLPEFLRAAMPKTPVADRLKHFRAYTRDKFEAWSEGYAKAYGEAVTPVTLDDIEKEIVTRKQQGFTEVDYCSEFCEFQMYIKTGRAHRAKAAALVRWKKSKENS